MKRMKYLLMVAVVVMMAFATIATATPVFAAGPSAPTAQQLITQLQNTKTSQEGYALWNSLTPAQQASINAIVSKTTSYKVVVTPASQSVGTSSAAMASAATISSRTYLITVYATDWVGYLWKFKLQETWYYNGNIITNAAPPLVTGESWRIGYRYDGAQTSSWYGSGNTAFYVNTVGTIAYGIYTPWGIVVTGHHYPWINAQYSCTGGWSYSGGPG